MDKVDVVIIGAGVSGLIAARELEAAGIRPVILEASDVPGGRLKTDRIDGYLLDHGFQVLLTAYPESRHYLDYDGLRLGTFDPGAVVYAGKKTYRLADPMRHPEKILPMLFSGIGKFSDKIKLARLTHELKDQQPQDIFRSEAGTTTHEYLKERGFSDKIIDQFFRPFFSGIFLEPELKTSSKMFRFVFKMFAEGQAALPADGIQAIPKQLVASLRNTEIRLGEKVERLQPGKVHTSAGTIEAEDILIATAPHGLLPGLGGQKQPFHDVLNLYFSCRERVINDRLIGLAANSSGLINNFCYPSTIHPGYAPDGYHLLSVSVVNVPDRPVQEVSKQVTREWHKITGQSQDDLELIWAYTIQQALPVMAHPAYSMQWTASKVQDHIFLAGDYLLYGSLNAAMTSGRTAAEAIIHNRH